jgi:hypothetical protein
VNGGVPQGTLSGPELFIHMVADLKTCVKYVKYVDDTSLVETAKKTENSDNMQLATDESNNWSKKNNLGINATKTKDMLMAFGEDLGIPQLTLGNELVERVHSSKLLGVIISDDLKWEEHIHYINSKAGKRLYYLRELKHAGLSKEDLICIYLALIRPVCEYACPVWSTCLTLEQKQTIESIQRRSLRIINPILNYDEARSEYNLPTLEERRDKLCMKFFREMCNPNHRLHHLVPQKRVLNLRPYPEYEVPKCNTERYKNSFIPWCLFNCQEEVIDIGAKGDKCF